MRWPWVSRRRLEQYRRLLKQSIAAEKAARKAARAGDEHVAVTNARCEELRDQLARSERERIDVNLKLLRVGFGVNPFHELFAMPEGQTLQQTNVDEENSGEPSVPVGATEDEARKAYVAEAVAQYGTGHLRKIAHHVQQRMDAFNSTRAYAPITAEERARASRIATDLQSAMDEGRAAQG